LLTGARAGCGIDRLIEGPLTEIMARCALEEERRTPLSAEDDLKWHMTFHRDFGHLYDARCPPLPPHVAAGEFVWTNRASKASHIAAHRPTGMPDPCSVAHGIAVPAPLAHAIGVGCGWRWAYRVHAHVLLASRADESGVPHWPKGAILRLGDIVKSSNALDGIGIVVSTDEDGRIQRWSVISRDGDTARGWLVSSDGTTYVESNLEHGARTEPTYLYGHGRSRWHFTTGRRLDGEERTVVNHCHAFGITNTYMRVKEMDRFEGIRAGALVDHMDGPYFEAQFECAETDDGRLHRHGRGVVRFRNGDVVVQRWVLGGLVGIEHIVCSPTCPNPLFAGVTLGAGIPWRISHFELPHGWMDNAYWPTGNSPDAALFWKYVQAGYIGWSPDALKHALSHMPEAARTNPPGASDAAGRETTAVC
jgi:hypothetical protein